jgi:predicted metal-dependent phosphotriesterase family hydrolase
MVMEVVTATGTLPADRIGKTLTHEHLFINLIPEFRGVGLVNDAALLAQELDAFTAAGGSTIIELTSAELTVGAAPDPAGYFRGVPDSGYPEHGTRTVNNVLGLRQLAETTGVNLILGTGHYRDPYLGDGWLDHRSSQQIADRMTADLTSGFPGTDVRAGIIGEIGADKWYISPVEERSFRAAARAHLATGATITTHAARWPIGVAQLDLLAAEGVASNRVIVGHCDGVNIPEYHLEIARRGAYVQLDTIRGSSTYDTEMRVDSIRRLIAAGHLDRILLSQDVCRRDHLRATGGCGYTYILEHFVERLFKAGIARSQIDQMLIENPRRALTGE